MIGSTSGVMDCSDALMTVESACWLAAVLALPSV